MATGVARYYAHVKGCISRYRQTCMSRKFHNMCVSYPARNIANCELRAKCLPQLSVPIRSLCSLTSRVTSRSSYSLSSSVVYSFMPYFCVKNRQDNYSSHAQRPKSRTHFYDVLSISPNATQSQIKGAYYELSKLYHPDINKDPSAHVQFSEISAAYEVLGNVRNRRLYDRGVLNPQRFKGHEGEDDGDGFHKEEGFTSRRRQAPTGHTSTYNFDEFYRQHYGESRKRQGQERALYEAYMRQLEDEQNQKRTNFMILMMLLSVGIAVWYSAMANLPKTSTPKTKKKD